MIMHFWHSLDILSIVFAQRFRRSIMVTWLKRFEHCQNLSYAIQVCQLWFNIVKRDLTEESLGQRAWSQLWQGTPISEHCGPWWPQYSRHCGHYYATKVNPATLHCDQAKVYYGVLLSGTMWVFLVQSSWHHRIMLLIKVGGPLSSSTRQDYSIFSITSTIRL